MREFIAFDGKTYPVSDFWAARVDSGLGAVWPSEDAAKSMRAFCLDLSNRGENNAETDARLHSASNLVDLHNKVRALQGRSLDEFGFTSLDQVVRNMQIKPCGCELQFIFDFHTREDVNGGERVHHPHFFRKTCSKHENLAADYKVHHETVMEEYRTKPDA